MKTSEFTDKKVTELSRSLSDDLSDRDDEDSDFSFQFRPRRPDVSSSLSQNRSFMDYTDRSREARVSDDGGALISMIDRKMEEHSKNLLHAVGGLSVRLSQLETRTMKIEDSVDELKDSSLFNHGRTERNLKELESVLAEVQAGIRDLKDKQEISKVQIQLTKLQILESRQRSEAKSTEAQSNEAKSNPTHHTASQQQYQTPSHQNLPAPQLPIQTLSQNQTPYSSDPTHQQYSAAAPIQPQPQPQPALTTPPVMYQTYQPVPYMIDPQSRFSSPAQQFPITSPTLPVDPQARHFPAQSFGEHPYTPHPNPIHGPPQQVYPGPRSSEFFSRHSGFRDDYDNNNNSRNNNSRYGPPSQYSGPSPSSSFNGNNRVSELPKARELPRALPMASEVDRRSDSGGTRNTAPVDDVIDNVVAMGFRRDLVRATVKKITESGRSVDLNVVLDKLMRSGEATNQRE